MRNMETQHSKCSQEHYNNTMYLMKDARNELELKRRHDKEQELNTALIEKKTLEKEALDAELEALNQRYLAMAELQASIAEANELKEKIEEAKVRWQMMQITAETL